MLTEWTLRADTTRLPFTAGRFRFDPSHKTWHGLDSGASFGF